MRSDQPDEDFRALRAMPVGPIAKVALGVATAWLPIYAVLFHLAVSTLVAGGRLPFGIPFTALIGGHIILLLDLLVLLTFYIAHLHRNPRFPKGRRLLWGVLFVFASFVAMPVYFVKYVWRSPSPPNDA